MVSPLQGLNRLGNPVPRAMPWAIDLRPVGAVNRVLSDSSSACLKMRNPADFRELNLLVDSSETSSFREFRSTFRKMAVDSAVSASRYEPNLVHLINTLRKDFDAPKAKFVVAVGCGNPGPESFGLQIASAQLAVDGDKGKYPEFKGNVKTIETRGFSALNPPEVLASPDNGFGWRGYSLAFAACRRL